MPWCGFNTRMITGLTMFAEGLFEATVERAREQDIAIDEAFRREIDELASFVEALEEKYQRLRTSGSATVMDELSDWVAEKDRSASG